MNENIAEKKTRENMAGTKQMDNGLLLHRLMLQVTELSVVGLGT